MLDYGLYLKHSHQFLKQLYKLKIHIANVQTYETTYEHSVNRPVLFLRVVKHGHLSEIQNTLHLTQLCQLSLTRRIKMEGLIKLQSEIVITARGNHQAGNDLLLSLMSTPVLKLSCTVTGVHKYEHITSVILDQVWISDRYNLIFADIATGYNVIRREDS